MGLVIVPTSQRFCKDEIHAEYIAVWQAHGKQSEKVGSYSHPWELSIVTSPPVRLLPSLLQWCLCSGPLCCTPELWQWSPSSFPCNLPHPTCLSMLWTPTECLCKPAFHSHLFKNTFKVSLLLPDKIQIPQMWQFNTWHNLLSSPFPTLPWTSTNNLPYPTKNHPLLCCIPFLLQGSS